MGLDTTHDCWHGAYSGFGLFREMVGRAAGLPYRIAKQQHRDGVTRYVLDVDWDNVTPDQIAGKWGKVIPTWQRPDDIYGVAIHDPVLYLLIHSDCDGKLHRKYLPELKERLEEIEPTYERMTANDDYLRGRLRAFINGLEAAIEQDQHVKFG